MDKNKRIRKRKLSTEEIIKLYREGRSSAEIGKLSNVSARYVNLLLKENNVERRPRGSWKRKYQLDEHYFKKWSNNMAYILGFFIADGTVARDAQFISMVQKEKYILENIKKEIGSDQPLYQNKKTGVYILPLNSKIMKEDIMNIHGIMPNKSSSAKFPNVPEEYMSHFVRGYFDGDGNINYEKYTVTFDRKHTSTRAAVAKRKLNFLAIYSVLNSEEETCGCLNIQITTLKKWIKADELFRYNYTQLSNIEEG